MKFEEEEKEKIIRQFLPKIKYHALRYLPVQNILEVDDLISAGIKGLLEALNKYNPNMNVPLASFIDYRIRGAILDEIRTLDTVSKEYRKKIEDVKKAYNELKKSGNEPTDREIAEMANITEEELKRVYQSMVASDIISLDTPIFDKNDRPMSIIDVISDEKNLLDHIQIKELHERLTQAIDFLSDIEKLVINLYYYEELNMREIAEILGVSLSRVSQIHGKALLKLKNMLE